MGGCFMDINDLKIYKMVAEEENISKTSIKSGFAQSTITNKIKKMENHFGTSFFYRNVTGVKLTPQGKDFLEYADKIINIFDEAEKGIKYKDVPSGTIKIGSMETTAAIRLPEILMNYSLAFPDVDLFIETGPTEVLIEKINNGDLEGAFVAEIESTNFLNKINFFKEELFIVGKNSFSREKIEDSNIVTFKKGCSYRNQFQKWMAEEEINYRRVLEFGSLEAILGCVRAGLGYTVLPLSVIDRMGLDKDLKIKKIPKEFGELDTVFVYKKNLSETKAFKEFINIAQERRLMYENN
jgi:DNA-binding transcriptional LysR family regulator